MNPSFPNRENTDSSDTDIANNENTDAGHAISNVDPAALSQRRMVLLTDGHSDPVTAKTASCLLRFCPEEVVAVLDRQASAKTSQELLGVGGAIPVVDSLNAASNADSLVIGIAPPGGRIPGSWRPLVIEAIQRGMTIYSGLHDFLYKDEEFSREAHRSGARLVDVRRNQEHEVSGCQGLSDSCLRIHTVGQDCGVGKMLVSVELSRALNRANLKTKFIATGQTGILVEGDGCPVDSVVSDFLSGAVEKMILKHQHHDAVVVEGQGSLAHPRYSAVTLGLLHGCAPHAMILCYEAGRETFNGLRHISLPSLRHLRSTYETMANLRSASKVIAVAMNSRLLSDQDAERERERIRGEFDLPVCDVVRHGADDLVNAVLDFRQRQDVVT